MARVWRQWKKVAAMAASSWFSEGPLFLLAFALEGLRLLVLLAIWRLILTDATPTEMGLETVLTYTLIAAVFGPLLDVRTGLPGAFWDGTITNYFTRPMGIVSQFAAPLLGNWLVGAILFAIPLVLVAPWLGVDPAPASLAAFAVFLVSLALAVVVGLALEFLFVDITVAIEQPVWLIEFVRRSIQPLLAGAVIPLALLPWGLGDLFAWLPFASLAWAPLAIYTDSAPVAGLLAKQLLWAVVLWPVALGMWSHNREKVVGHGG